jgi:hypothetical protein
VRHEGVVEQGELAEQEGFGARSGGDLRARGADGGERLGIGEEGAAGQLCRGAARVGGERRLGVRFPPRLGELELERAEAGFDVGDELGRREGPAGFGGRAVGVGRGDDGRVTGDRLVDHHPSKAIAASPTRRLSCGAGGAAPLDLLRRRRERGWACLGRMVTGAGSRSRPSGVGQSALRRRAA